MVKNMIKNIISADIKMDKQKNLGPADASEKPAISSPLPLMAARVFCAPVPATLYKDSGGSTWLWLRG